MLRKRKLSVVLLIWSTLPSSVMATMELADPTRPPTLQRTVVDSENVDASPLRLQAIFGRVSKPQALINDRLVRAGEQTKDFKVLKITKNSVFIEYANGQASELVLNVNIKDET